MPPGLQMLPWDTKFFGYTTGRIDMPSYDEKTLEMLLEEARRQGCKLLYVFMDGHTVLSPDIVRGYTSGLVDTKVTYSYEVGPSNTVATAGSIRKFSGEQDVVQLYELAYQSGEYSRFRADSRVGEENFKRLYRQWIDKSLSGQAAESTAGTPERAESTAADTTFVYVMDAAIRGFVTVQRKQPVATIDLLATDKSVRGRGIGSALLDYVKQDLRSSLAVRLEVATQKKNTTACRFYERNGFVLQSEVNVYHIWL